MMSGGEREQEQGLERHHEMAGRHQGGADHDGAALAEQAVGDEAAEERGEIDQPGVEAVDLRCEGLHAERAGDALEQAAQAFEPDDAVGAARGEQVFRHVEDEQRPHAVIGEALPHLGGEQESQAARMAEQIPGRFRVADLVGA